MSKVMGLPDDITEEEFESLTWCFVYPVGIKMMGEGLELHIDNGCA